MCGDGGSRVDRAKADWCDRSNVRERDVVLMKPAERENSRIVIGRHYDILDSSVSSQYAGRRVKGSGVSDLFSSMAEESRSVNRKQHFIDSSTTHTDKNNDNADGFKKSRATENDDSAKEHMFYVPPKRKQDKGRRPFPKHKNVGRANSIVLKKKSPETITKEYQAKQERENLVNAYREKRRKESESEVSLLRIEPINKGGNSEPMEIVFCPVNQKQPKLKFVLDQPEKTYTTNTREIESKSTERAVKYTGDDIKFHDADQMESKKIKVPEIEAKTKPTNNDNLKKTAVLKQSESKIEQVVVNGGNKHVNRLQAARSNKAYTPKPQVTSKEVSIQKQTQKTSLKNVKQEEPQSPTKTPEVHPYLESSPEPISDRSPERSSPVFRIILPRITAVKPREVVFD